MCVFIMHIWRGSARWRLDLTGCWFFPKETRPEIQQWIWIFFFFFPLYGLEKWRRQYFSGQQSKHFFPSFFIFSFLKINLLDVTEAFFPQRWNGRCQRLKAKSHFHLASAFSVGAVLFLFFFAWRKKRSAHLGSELQLVFVLGSASMRHQSKSNLLSIKI